ncbi:MAG: PorP/SprF family type IX secretion system membrane protein [Bacteroidales bacterium]|nr:PorP/SprF family type IX secretion system membrane protein [Bacteroidales bacterium]
MKSYKIMKSLLKIVVAIVACLCMHIDAVAQDVSFSQTYQAPLYLSPSYTGLTNGSRFGLNYRNQWPGIGHVYQDYAFFFDHFFDQYHSGIGFQWVCDNMGKGLMLDNQMSILYSYEVAFSSDLFFRPGIAFEFGQRKIDQSKMITYTDIAADGRYHMGGSSIEFDRTKKSRFDAAVSAMIYNDTYSFGVSIDHLLRPDASFTDTKDKIGTKVVVDGSYRIEYEPSYRGSEPKSITIAADFRHQYSFNQLELGLYWYFFPIEVGAMYRGLFFKVAGEKRNTDAIVPSLGVNIPVSHRHVFRVGYSYDITISNLSSFGNGAHEVSLIYRLSPDDVARRGYKMKPVPCSEPIMGYSYSGSGSRGSGYHKGRRATYRRRGIRK